MDLNHARLPIPPHPHLGWFLFILPGWSRSVNRRNAA